MSGSHDDFDDDFAVFGVGADAEKARTEMIKRANESKVAAEVEQRNMIRHVDEKAKTAYAVIVSMLNTAHQSGLQTPKFRAEGLIISRAPDTGKNPGAIYVKRDNDAQTYIGKITNKGEWWPTRDANMGDSEALKRICENPLDAAIAYGRKTGNCSMCGRTLTNAVSIKLGIGPICGGRFGIGDFSAEEIKADSYGEPIETEYAASPLPKEIGEDGPVVELPSFGDKFSVDATLTVNGVELTKAELLGKMLDVIGDDMSDEEAIFLTKQFNKIANIIMKIGE